MEILSQQRCYHHHLREAVVRCPACRRYFCRECVTEHDDRMLCSGCLERLTGTVAGRSRHWGLWLSMLLQGSVGFVLLWAAFYLVGRMLLAIPDAFHEGTIWQGRWWEVP